MQTNKIADQAESRQNLSHTVYAEQFLNKKELVALDSEVDSLSYFSFRPVLHDWCNKGCGMVDIKEVLLLIGKSSPCNGGSGNLLLP